MSTVLQLPPLEVDLAGAMVRLDGEQIASLTPLELRLLRYLADVPGKVVSREELLVAVWDYRPGVQSRAVTFTVNRLRAKIETDKAVPRYLLTVRGVGFQLRVPRLVPSWWVGDSAWFNTFEEQLQDHDRLAVVGRAGAGKSALVRAWAGQARQPVVVVDLTAVEDVAGAWAAVAEALSIDAGGAVDDLRERISQVVEGTTLVLDGGDALSGEVAGMCVGLPCRVVVTARVAVPGMSAWALPRLSVEHAVELLVLRAKAHCDDWAADTSTLAALGERLDRLPLAIELASASARWFSAEELLSRLHQDLGVGAEQALSDAIGWALALLSPMDRRVFAWMAVFAGEVSFHQVESVMAQLDVPLPAVLQALERHGLLQTSSAGTVRLAVGVREASRSTLEASGERMQAEQAHRMSMLAEEVPPVDDLLRIQARDRIDHPDLAQQALRKALPLLPSRRTVAWIGERIEQTAQPGHSLDPSVQAYAGWVAWRMGDRDAAQHLLASASVAAKTAGDVLALSQAEAFAGAMLQEAGRRAEALEQFRRAVVALRGTELNIALGRALNALAIGLTHIEAFEEARDHLFEGLECSADDADCQALLLNTLGNLYLREGRLDDASRSYDRAIEHLVEGRRSGLGAPSAAVVESNLASVRMLQGRLGEAEMLYERAAVAHRASGRRRSLGLTRASLGRVQHLDNRMEQAIESFRAAVALLEGVDDFVQASWTRAFHVAALLDADQPEEAARSQRLLRSHEASTGRGIGPALEALLAVHHALRGVRAGTGTVADVKPALEQLELVAHPELAPMVRRLRLRQRSMSDQLLP